MLRSSALICIITSMVGSVLARNQRGLERRELLALLPGSSTEVCRISSTGGPCSGSIVLQKPGDYFLIAIEIPDSILSFEVQDADGIGGFSLIAVNRTGLAIFQDPYANNLPLYPTFSCLPATNGVAALLKCEQEGRHLVDQGAPVPFYLVA